MSNYLDEDVFDKAHEELAKILEESAEVNATILAYSDGSGLIYTAPHIDILKLKAAIKSGLLTKEKVEK